MPRYFLFSDISNEPVYGIRLEFKDITCDRTKTDINSRSHYFVDVFDTHHCQVMFVFTHIGPCTNTITDIYFDDSHFTRIVVEIIADKHKQQNASGKCTEPDCRETYLPIADSNINTFQCMRTLSAGNQYKSECSGISFSERLGIVFDLMEGVSIPDIISALQNEKLNVGIKVLDNLSGVSRIIMNDPELHLSTPMNPPKLSLSQAS
jgi:hypothetical protein